MKVIINIQVILEHFDIQSFTLSCVCAKFLQLYPTLCDPIDHSLSGFSVHGICQARILEWIAIPSSNGSSNSGTEPAYLMSPALAGGFFTASPTWDAL